MAEVSKYKTELAVQATADLTLALKGNVPDRLQKGFMELFESLPNKSLERLRGLLAGIEMGQTPKPNTTPQKDLSQIVEGIENG